MEKVLLVGLKVRGKEGFSTDSSMNELALLAKTARAHVAKTIVQSRNEIDPACLIGYGKVLEIASICQEMGIHTVIFDKDLTPTQQRNLEEQTNCKIIDRTRLILDIFGQRAHSMEGKLEVELAQLEYFLPRLTGRGISLSQQYGGIGTKGPGEKKLEVDRRKIRDRITHLKSELEHIRLNRAQQRRKRIESEIPLVGIVGYTNAGKTSLFNALTRAGAFVEDKLFATLDTRVRRMFINQKPVLFSDTVGFIDNLPHSVVAAFRATLEEIDYANLLVHVVDVNEDIEKQTKVVHKVLGELGVSDKPFVTVYNKIDLITSLTLGLLKDSYPEGIFISATRDTGIDEFIGCVTNTLESVNRRGYVKRID